MKKLPELDYSLTAYVRTDNNNLEKLLKMGYDVNEQDDDDRTVLMNACRNGFTDLVKMIMRFKPDVNLTDELGNPALFWSIYAQDYKSTEMLLKAGADINYISPGKTTAMMMALFNEADAKMMKLLYKYKPDLSLGKMNGKNFIDLVKSNYPKHLKGMEDYMKTKTVGKFADLLR